MRDYNLPLPSAPQYLQAAASLPVIPLIYWLAGFNFNERGAAALFCLLFAAGLYVLAFEVICRLSGKRTFFIGS